MEKEEIESKSSISFVAVGDVFIDGKAEHRNGTVAHVKRETPESAFELVSSFFRKADLRFCNLEGPLGDLSKKEKIFSGR